MNVIYKSTDELIPYINNPRQNDNAVDAVASSIKNFGFKQPIVIDSNNEIIAGHTRLKAAKKLHIEEVPCIIADDLTPAQIKAYRLADNKVSELASWDDELLFIELDGVKLDINMDAFGFDMGAYEDTPFSDVIEDDYDGEVPEEPKSKLGDIYQLGKHKLLCGDSTLIDNINALVGEEFVDALVTDPPYNVACEGKTKDKLTIENDKQDNESFRQFLYDAFVGCYTAMNPGASFYIFHADSEGLNFRGACIDAGLEIKQCLIWNKNTLVMGRQDYHWKHEPILYGWKPGGSHSWYGDRKQTTVIDFEKPQRNGEHPTMKPIGLVAYLLQNSTKQGDIVLDTFGGSGTTLLACEQLNRTCYMMELDPRYVDVIINRWEQLTGGTAELIV